MSREYKLSRASIWSENVKGETQSFGGRLKLPKSRGKKPTGDGWKLAKSDEKRGGES